VKKTDLFLAGCYLAYISAVNEEAEWYSEFFLFPTLFAICTSTFNKCFKGMQKSAH
jgi:hypothetical protein